MCNKVLIYLFFSVIKQQSVYLGLLISFTIVLSLSSLQGVQCCTLSFCLYLDSISLLYFNKPGIYLPVMSWEHSTQMEAVDLVIKVDVKDHYLDHGKHTCAHKCPNVCVHTSTHAYIHTEMCTHIVLCSLPFTKLSLHLLHLKLLSSQAWRLIVFNLYKLWRKLGLAGGLLPSFSLCDKTKK